MPKSPDTPSSSGLSLASRLTLATIILSSACLDCAASEVFAYRVVPIASAPYATPSNAPSGLLSFPPWPARYDWGTALRARFMSQSRIAATTARLDGNLVLRRMGVIVQRVTPTSPWMTDALPVPDGYLDSVVTDANADGTIVGACIAFGTNQYNSLATAGSWRTAGDTISLSLNAPCVVDESPYSSSHCAIGSADASGEALVCGVIRRRETDDYGFPYQTQIGQNGSSLPLGLGGGELCIPPSVGAPTFDWVAGRPSAIGFNPNIGVSVALGSSRVVYSEVDLGAGCVDAPAWFASRWDRLAPQTIRAPYVCPDVVPSAYPTIQLSETVLGLDRAAHISAVCDPSPPEEHVPIAVGAIDYEIWVGAPETHPWCDSSANCRTSRGTAFTKPYARSSDITTFDLHAAILATIDGGDSAFPQSDVARVVMDANTRDYWIAVGARMTNAYSDPSAPAGRTEGVIWHGNADDPQLWCGRSMDDAALTQRVCAVPVGQSAQATMRCEVTALHDVLPSGAALGIGRFLTLSGEGSPEHERWLVLLTEGCDINGDLRVDQADLRLLKHALGTGNPDHPSVADLNGDSHVDQTDLTAMLKRWGDGHAGREVMFDGLCPGRWVEVPVLPIHSSIHMLGLGSPSDFTAEVASLDPDSAVSLCCLVVDLARALVQP